MALVSGTGVRVVAKLALACVLLASLQACGRHGGDDASGSQVAAQVNDGEISVHQVDAFLRQQPMLAQQWGDQARQKALDGLIEQELAAQAATKAGLDKSPAVIQALALAKRAVLARAYEEDISAKLNSVDSAAVGAFYDAHPELFAHRKQYQLAETLIPGSAEDLTRWGQVVESLPSLEALNAWLAQERLAHRSGRSTQWAEQLPAAWVQRLAKLPVGHSIATLQPQGLYVVTVVQADEAPVLLGAATPMITASLQAQARKQAIEAAMQQLHQQAHISRQLPQAASATASPASADSAVTSQVPATQAMTQAANGQAADGQAATKQAATGQAATASPSSSAPTGVSSAGQGTPAPGSKALEP